MFDDKKDISKAEVRVAKGVQKSVIFNNLRFSTKKKKAKKWKKKMI